LTVEQWLAGLEVGDEVAEYGGSFGSRAYVSKVTKVTKASIYVGAVAYKKSNGQRRVSGLFTTPRISPVTQEIRHAAEFEDLREWLEEVAERLYNDDQRPTLAQLRAMKVAYEKEKP
jgi:hypothetical protein